MTTDSFETNGFVRKPCAPAFTALTVVEMSANAVIISTSTG